MKTTISPTELHNLARDGKQIMLLDVRTPAEFGAAHVEFARNEPITELNPATMQKLDRERAGAPIYVICQSGGRSRQACEKLAAAGCAEVVDVEGGTAAWIAAGLPVTRGKKVMSLERQVRIAAGSLVLAGSLAGLFIHPYFIGLAAFVGAGLVFAGVTDTCGMGMLLARMPWNQVKPALATGTVSGAACPR